MNPRRHVNNCPDRQELQLAPTGESADQRGSQTSGAPLTGGLEVPQSQGSLLDTASQSGAVLPPGMRYQREFLGMDEERELVELLQRLPLEPMRYKAYTARRKVLSFGGSYDLKLQLQPRSIYLLRGPARWAWQHSVSPTRSLRYSITFRTRSRRGRSAPH